MHIIWCKDCFLCFINSNLNTYNFIAITVSCMSHSSFNLISMSFFRWPPAVRDDVRVRGQRAARGLRGGQADPADPRQLRPLQHQHVQRRRAGRLERQLHVAQVLPLHAGQVNFLHLIFRKTSFYFHENFIKTSSFSVKTACCNLRIIIWISLSHWIFLRFFRQLDSKYVQEMHSSG